MEWNVLVSDADPWVMYRVFMGGLLYIYIPDMWKVIAISYMASSLSYIISLGLGLTGSMVHHMFTYPVAVTIGTFVSKAVAEKPCKHPILHILTVIPWTAAGFYGPLGYPIFIFPYVTTLLIARMYSWAIVAGLCMTLNGAMFPLHSPLLSLILPIAVLFVYSCFEDIYHDTPLYLEV